MKMVENLQEQIAEYEEETANLNQQISDLKEAKEKEEAEQTEDEEKKQLIAEIQNLR